jgi:hypothetical protein
MAGPTVDAIASLVPIESITPGAARDPVLVEASTDHVSAAPAGKAVVAPVPVKPVPAVVAHQPIGVSVRAADVLNPYQTIRALAPRRPAREVHSHRTGA